MYSGPLDCIIKTCTEKGIRGMYKGYFATIMRESPGSSLWYVLYYLALLYCLLGLIHC
jgi:hypothetical protein